MNRRRCFALAVVGTALAEAALARGAPAQVPDTATLAPIVVTATRMPAPSNTLANSVTVLEADDLARAGITTVSDALSAVGGAAVVRSGSFGAVTSLFLRGGESDYVRVLVDGVPINAPGGALNLANLSTLNVERIELVRGPSSVLYGSDAVSGVMQIFTRSGRGRRGQLEASLGRYGSSEAAAQLTAGGRRAGASLAASQASSDGLYEFNSRYRNATLSSLLRVAPDSRSELAMAARYSDALFHYPTDGSGAVTDSNQYATSRWLTASLDAGRYLTQALEMRLLLGYSGSHERTNDAPDNAADTTGLYEYYSRAAVSRRSADLRLNLHAGPASVLTAGGAVEAERERSSNEFRSSFGPGGGSTSVDRTNRAAYAQAVTGWRGRLFLQAGVRLDHNRQFGRFVTWRLGGAARIAAAMRLRATIGTAFKEPAFYQNFSTGYTTGNPDLRPERSRSWEIGVERLLDEAKGSFSVSYFHQTFRDMIQYTFNPPEPGGPNYYNVAGANASGVELEGRFTPSRSLQLSGQYTLLSTSVADSGFDGATFAPGRPLIRRPAHSAALEVRLVPGGPVLAGWHVVYVGRREDLDFSTYPSARVTLAAYTRVDLWAEAVLHRGVAGRSRLSLTARLENASDAKYTEVYGFRTPRRRLAIGARLAVGD